MTDPVRTDLHDNVAVIRIDNPPVNALGHAVRTGLFDAVERALADDAVKAIVLVGEGRVFVGGADIREFNAPEKMPGLNELIERFETSGKPIVVSVHGIALGGGLELALACHFRVATADAKLGLPEVKLGLIPGAGGTQRLPRAVGPVLAVKMIATGEPISAREALDAGLVDEIVEDRVAGAVAFAQRMIASGARLRKLRDEDNKIAPVRQDRSAFDAAAAAATARAKGLKAPHACVEAVGWTLDLPFDTATARERETFFRLASGTQGRAQIHAFFAEREAAKLRDVPEGTRARPVKEITVIGAGTMGGGIAMSFANAGLSVTIIEQDAAPLERGLALIRRNYEATAARGGISQEEMEARLGRISGKVGLSAASQADLIVEAVFETMEIKKQVFGQLDAIAKPGAILATNTSFLDVNEIAAVTARPQDVLGMHFFSPANVMKLCEIVRGDKTAPDALATAVAVARKAGKTPVVVGVCYGFVGNRMLTVRGQQADALLYQGVPPQQIDAALTRFGMPMGHFAMMDLAGLDIGWRARQGLGQTSPIEDALCEAGRLGQKTGKGFYLYNPGSRVPQVDPEVEDLISRTISDLKLPTRSVDDEEVLERLIYPMINEGAKLLEEGIAARPGDIDIVWLYGYGWPIGRCGPMFYGDQVGLAHVAERLRHYAEQDGNRDLLPSPLLERLAREGSRFADWRPKG